MKKLSEVTEALASDAHDVASDWFDPGVAATNHVKLLSQIVDVAQRHHERLTAKPEEVKTRFMSFLIGPNMLARDEGIFECTMPSHAVVLTAQAIEASNEMYLWARCTPSGAQYPKTTRKFKAFTGLQDSVCSTLDRYVATVQLSGRVFHIFECMQPQSAVSLD